MPSLRALRSAFEHLDLNFKKLTKEVELNTKMADEFNAKFGSNALKFEGGAWKFFGDAVDGLKSADDLATSLKKVPDAQLKAIDDALATPKSKEFFADPDLQAQARKTAPESKANIEDVYCQKDATGNVIKGADGAPVVKTAADSKLKVMLARVSALALGGAALSIGAMQLVANARKGCWMVDTKKTVEVSDDKQVLRITSDPDKAKCTCAALADAGTPQTTNCKNASKCTSAMCTGTECMCGADQTGVVLTAVEASWVTVLTDIAAAVSNIITTAGDALGAALDGLGKFMKALPWIGLAIGIIIIIALGAYFGTRPKKPPAP